MMCLEPIQVFEGDGVNPRWKEFKWGDGRGFPTRVGFMTGDGTGYGRGIENGDGEGSGRGDGFHDRENMINREGGDGFGYGTGDNNTSGNDSGDGYGIRVPRAHSGPGLQE